MTTERKVLCIDLGPKMTQEEKEQWHKDITAAFEVIKAKKQELMTEEADLIYRLNQEIPRRVFFIDTGNMTYGAIKSELERVRTEIAANREE